MNITNTNTNYGWTDVFEAFTSYKDNKEYIISPHNNNYNLDLYELISQKKINSFKGHQAAISTIRYFINKKDTENFKEYLISADINKLVIIWDITNNYNIIHKINTIYAEKIYSCLLIFPHNLDNFIITSSLLSDIVSEKKKSVTKIYSLNNGQLIKIFNNTKMIGIFYLLSWYNKKNNDYYIIQFADSKIIINNLLKAEYFELKKEMEGYSYLSGFVYNSHNKDYLCDSSVIGLINIWDLYEQTIFKIIDVRESYLTQLIEWNNKYIIVVDFENKCIKIIDLDEFKIIGKICSPDNQNILSIKKINHPIYEESLLVANNDGLINLFSF